MADLTGNHRFVAKRRLFAPDLVAVQVEEVIQSESNQGYGLLPEFITVWRDATPEDMAELDLSITT